MFLLLTFFLGDSSKASDYELSFTTLTGGSNADYGTSVTADGSGNVYTAGYFGDVVDFDPGAGVTNLTTAGSKDAFIQKLDEDGDFVWARSIGGTSIAQAEGIVVDASENVYVTGWFRDSVDLDPGAGVYNLDCASDSGIFVTKLNSAGDFVWARGTCGNSNTHAREISIDTSGNIYIVGMFDGEVDFDPGPGTFNLTSAGLRDVFIAKLDSSGDFEWAHSFGSAAQDFGYSIEVDTADNVYVTGFFSNTVDFDPGVGVVNRMSIGDEDVFVEKLDSSGNIIWVKTFGGIWEDRGFRLAVDFSGYVYVTGDFRNTVDFDPGVGIENRTSDAAEDVFVLKLDGFGNFVWVETFGSGGEDIGRGIDVDILGNVYVSGYFRNTTDFDPGPGTYFLTSNGFLDIFVQKLDSSGNFEWATSMGNSANDYGFDVAVDESRNVFTTGTSSYDIFLSKHSPIAPFANSIGRSSLNPTNSSSVDFTVIFNDSVTGVDSTDFTIDASGVAGSSITGVTGAGDTYMVTVNTGIGDGTLSIDVIDDDSIIDSDSDPLGGVGVNNGDFSIGETYTIDKTPPVVSIGAPSATDTSSGPVVFNISYTGAFTINLTSDDVTLHSSGTATAGSVNVANGATAAPIVTLSNISGDGPLGISISSGTSADVIGNFDIGVGPGATFNVDNTPPAVTVNFRTTNDSTPSLSGSIDDASAAISVTVNAETHSAVNNGTTWSLPDGTLTTLQAGTYDVTVTAVDALGNAGSDNTEFELTIAPNGNGDVITANLPPERRFEGVRLVLTAPAGYSSYQWKLDGVPMFDDTPRVTGTASQILILDPLQMSDAGLYSVQFEDGITRNVSETDNFEVIVLAPQNAMPLGRIGFLAMLVVCLLLCGRVAFERRNAD